MTRSEQALKLKEQGLSYPEIADEMGISWGGAVSYVSEARQRYKGKPSLEKVYKPCWYCSERECYPALGSYHSEVKAKMEYEAERELRHRTGKYTELANGSRLYRREA